MVWKGVSPGWHISLGAQTKNVTGEVRGQTAIPLEGNLITGLNKDRKGMVECGHHLRIPVMVCVSLERPQNHIHMPGPPLTESGELSRLLNSLEPQFPNLEDGNDGVVVKMKGDGRTGHIAVLRKDKCPSFSKALKAFVEL